MGDTNCKSQKIGESNFISQIAAMELKYLILAAFLTGCAYSADSEIHFIDKCYDVSYYSTVGVTNEQWNEICSEVCANDGYDAGRFVTSEALDACSVANSCV